MIELNIYPDDQIIYCDTRPVKINHSEWRILLAIVEGNKTQSELKKITNIQSNSIRTCISSMRRKLGVNCISTKNKTISLADNVRTRVYK